MQTQDSLLLLFKGTIPVSRQLEKNPGAEHRQDVQLRFFLNNGNGISCVYKQITSVHNISPKPVSLTSASAALLGQQGPHFRALVHACRVLSCLGLCPATQVFICFQYLQASSMFSYGRASSKETCSLLLCKSDSCMACFPSVPMDKSKKKLISNFLQNILCSPTLGRFVTLIKILFREFSKNKVRDQDTMQRACVTLSNPLYLTLPRKWNNLLCFVSQLRSTGEK